MPLKSTYDALFFIYWLALFPAAVSCYTAVLAVTVVVADDDPFRASVSATMHFILIRYIELNKNIGFGFVLVAVGHCLQESAN